MRGGDQVGFDEGKRTGARWTRCAPSAKLLQSLECGTDNWSYLSAPRKPVGRNDLLIEASRSLGVARLASDGESHVVQSVPVCVALVPFKLVQQGPARVPSHIDTVFQSWEDIVFHVECFYENNIVKVVATLNGVAIRKI